MNAHYIAEALYYYKNTGSTYSCHTLHISYHILQNKVKITKDFSINQLKLNVGMKVSG